MGANANDRVFIVIVTYNATRWIDKCFRNFANLPESWQVIAVDNNSSDNTVNELKKKYSFVKVIENKENKGFGQANNIAIKYAVGKECDYVFLLNQDAWISICGIKKLIEIQKKNDEYYIISPLHYNGNSTNFDRAFIDYVKKSRLLFDITNGTKKEVYGISEINAAAWLISRKSLEEVGGFSPSFFHYGEDDNYLMRVLYHGGKIGVSPEAVVYHDREKSMHKSSFFSKRASKLRYKTVLLSNPWSHKVLKRAIRYFFCCIETLYFAQIFKLAEILRNREKSKLRGRTFIS